LFNDDSSLEEKVNHSKDDIQTKDNALSISELKEFLKMKLPDYMIPSYFMELLQIPLTNNGKVDVKALPDIGRHRMNLELAYMPPGNEIEKTIADTWKDVLKLDKVGINDNFFDLGGNSLDIVKVHRRLKSILNKDIPLVSMFRYTTVGYLARYFAHDEEESPLEDDRSDALEQGERKRALRLQIRKKIKKTGA
jgi:acyl carrier protein